jgi:hypothetical protein
LPVETTVRRDVSIASAFACCALAMASACSDGTEAIPEPNPVPNGRIVWASAIDDPQGYRSQIYSVEGDGRLQLQLTSEFSVYEVLGAFGARRVAFRAFDPQATPQYTYYTMLADGAGRTGPFTFDFHPYDVSLDGARIAGHNETGEQRIGIGNLLTGETTYLSTAPLVPYDVFWAPGGDRIGFTGRLNDAATSDIYTIRTDGGGPTKLTDDAAYEGDLRWSPDGRRILYVRSGPGMVPNMSVIDADGSNLKQIYAHLCAMPMAWSPDGSQVLCTSYASGRTEAIIDVETGVARPTGFRFWCPGWSPDGTRLLCADTTGIYTLDPDGKDEVKVAPLSTALPMVWLRGEG